LSPHKEGALQNLFRELKEGLYLYLTKHPDKGFACEQPEMDSVAKSEAHFRYLGRKDKEEIQLQSYGLPYVHSED